MNALLVAFLLISAALKTPLVASNRVLVCFDASLVVALNNRTNVFVCGVRRLFLPAKRQVGGGDNLDKVHVVESLLIRVLICTIQRVDVVVRPATRTSRQVVLRHVLHNNVAQLGSKTQVVDFVSERVRVFVLEVVFKVVYVQVTIGEGFSRCNVEVSNNLVDLDAALKATSLLALGVKVFSVMLALALLNTLSTTERPRYGGVGVADFVAGVTAAGLLCVGGGGGTVAFATVVGGKVRGFVSVSVASVSYCTLSSNCCVTRMKQTHRSRALVSISLLPSFSGLSRTLLMPCATPICSSPDTSMISRVSSSQGIRGNVTFKLISMRSPLPLSTINSGRTVTRL